MTDIVEKLKDACVIDRHYGKSVTLTLDYDDYMEAADLITALRAENERLKEWNREIALNAREFAAENERLRAALEEIASGKYSGIVLTSYPPQDPAVNRARAALEEKR